MFFPAHLLSPSNRNVNKVRQASETDIFGPVGVISSRKVVNFYIIETVTSQNFGSKMIFLGNRVIITKILKWSYKESPGSLFKYYKLATY